MQEYGSIATFHCNYRDDPLKVEGSHKAKNISLEASRLFEVLMLSSIVPKMCCLS